MSNGVINKRLKFIAILLLLPVGVIVPALIIDGHSSSQYHYVHAQNDPEFEERKRNYRAQLTDDLISTEEERIRQRCDAVRTNIRSLDNDVGVVKTERNAAYDAILEELNDLMERLNAQAFETSQLESNLDTLESKIDKFKSDMDDYIEVVNDLTNIDCRQDQEAFQGALQIARQYNGRLLPQNGDIRSYIVNTIKPTLEKVREDIEAGRTTGGGQ